MQQSPYFLEHLLQDSDQGDVSDAGAQQQFPATGLLARADEVIE